LALTLHLLRHAKSSWSEAGQDDHERPLNGRGRRAAKLMGRFLAGEGPAPERVLCSSAVRTRETWQRIEDCLASRPEVVYERSLYLAPAEGMLERIRGEPDAACLLVIGHNPGTEELARLLAGSGDEEAWRRLRDKFPTAALATLAFDAERWSELSPAAGRLLRFVTPGDVG
jgi:phosphohistidine phosphatase